MSFMRLRSRCISLKYDPSSIGTFVRTVGCTNYLRIALQSASRCDLEKSCETDSGFEYSI